MAAALLGGVTAPAVLLAPVAAAHSVLISVDPEDGSQLDAAPEQIVLTFNEEVNRNFASVAVTAGDDRANRVAGEPMVDGETVTARVDDLAPGAYTVGYRVTSADGHVVSGSSVFTVAGAEGGAAGGEGGAGAEGSAAGGATAADAGGESADADATEADVADETSGESSGVNPVIWVVGGLAVLLIGGAFVLLRRGGGSGSGS
ncbi:copper resistance protein CopC [Dietzia cinnamea]|uniref:Copper resistance protein CopC n=1 Tax=Dietzia cinnamea TaxID=321318 RepID=A0AAW5QD69_9ACTN|nr:MULTISPECIES: copper resistance CopC family protein [Dietzia]MCT1863835.1 copper resistance protein CopC [Dietzia cinnamea]MCT2030120.1 copper resistance protein CopC [Dietzia cinnamea]MCT2034951.1 copper resistance protein CopC [Dietzia cinnamea]MCT2077552.1 copper resistance protein CopC [Dietzia cinnamea]MCT2109769.1 copper resistance protein CopC [Dietzia cinnamea]